MLWFKLFLIAGPHHLVTSNLVLPMCPKMWMGGKAQGWRRRISTEEKSKILAAVWRTEWIHFIAALAMLQEKDEFIVSSNRPGAIHPICQIVLVQNS